MVQEQSWIAPPPPPQAEVLDHEQGHMDIDQQIAIQAQARINQMIQNGQLKGTGATEQETTADLEQKIQNVIDEVVDSLHGNYDTQTTHGSNRQAQAAARAAQRAALNPANNARRAAQANTRAGNSMDFNAATKALTVTGDTIQGLSSNGPEYTPSESDPIIGAEIKHPTFTLKGQTTDGKFYFRAEDAEPKLTIEQGGNVLFSTVMDMLMYDPVANTFYALGKGIQFAPSESDFLSALSSDLTSGDLALFCSILCPDANFATLTANYYPGRQQPGYGLRICQHGS